MEGVKKQADAMSRLEHDLEKSKRQEREYEEAIESLQSELDKIAQENNQLKLNAPATDSAGTSSLLNLRKIQLTHRTQVELAAEREKRILVTKEVSKRRDSFNKSTRCVVPSNSSDRRTRSSSRKTSSPSWTNSLPIPLLDHRLHFRHLDPSWSHALLYRSRRSRSSYCGRRGCFRRLLE